MKTVDLTCYICNKSFAKPLNEYTRRLKKGAERFCCSKKCGADLGRPYLKPVPPERALTLDPANRRDASTPFRWFLLRVRCRSGRKGLAHTDLDLEYLSDLWHSQSGICPLSGWAMNMPRDTKGFADNMNPRNASLDRKDPSKGYLRGNVRYVCLIANFAKSVFTDEVVRDFCKAVCSTGVNLNKLDT